jgi:hypothetical protein
VERLIVMESQLPMILVSVVSSLIVGVASSYLTFRLQFERFKAMDEQREEDWAKWRDGISRDVKVLERSVSVTEIALLAQRLLELERRLGSIEKTLSDHWSRAT